MKERIGQNFGNYRLVRLLGRGGFAEVYLGEHRHLQTQAAIKVLQTSLAQEDEGSFLKEARIVASLEHPHIVRVLDFDVQESIPFLVMSYAPNGSIRQRHPKGTKLPLPTVVDYVQQVSEALQYAHNGHFIHRDIKPENLLVGRHQEILLSDFGIALIAQNSRLQGTQEVIGTASYMAPEQFQGKPRQASDQYALGIMVYEWLCGSQPFSGSFTEIASQHMFAPPPPLRARVPDLPVVIEQVVQTALSKDPAQRFASVQAFATALEQAYQSSPSMAKTQFAQAYSPTATAPIQTTVGVSSPPTMPAPLVPDTPTVLPSTKDREKRTTQRRVSRRVVLAGLGALVVVGGGAGAARYLLSPHYPPQGTLIYTYPGHNDSVNAVAWHTTRIASGSSDMTVQVWDATTGGNPYIYRNHTAQVNAVAWSPDGQYIVSASMDGTAQVWNASSATLTVKYTGHMKAGNVRCVTWSPDSQYIASGGDDGTVQVWNASNGKHIYTYIGHISNGTVIDVQSVAWSPENSRIVSGDINGSVQVWDALTGKNVYKYSGHQTTVNSLAWSPDGTQIASGGDDHSVQVWRPATQGQALVYLKHTDTVTSIAWSHDGQFVASASADKSVHVWQPINSSLPYIFKHRSGAVNAVAWTDDSHRLVSGNDDHTVQVWEGV